MVVFAAQEDVALFGLNGPCADDHAFHQQMRVVFQQVAVLEGARLHFVGVADEVFRALHVLRHEAPFHAGWKSGAASATQIRVLH